MHPQIARQLIAQRNADLAAMARRPARLSAGRAPNSLGVGPFGPWVTVAYIACMFGVGMALLIAVMLLALTNDVMRWFQK